MLFIFEGPDGTGKSSQVETTAAWLQQQGLSVTATREPGGDPKFGPAIREMLLNDGDKVKGTAELFGFMFDRGLHMANIVIPAILRGDIVLCDRMFESSLVYQGVVKGHGLHTVNQLNSIFLKGEYAPFVDTFTCLLFDAPDDVLEARIDARGATDDKHDRAGFDFRQKVRQTYRDLATDRTFFYPRVTVDASGEYSAVQHLIRKQLAKKLADFRGLTLDPDYAA